MDKIVDKWRSSGEKWRIRRRTKWRKVEESHGQGREGVRAAAGTRIGITRDHVERGGGIGVDKGVEKTWKTYVKGGWTKGGKSQERG